MPFSFHKMGFLAAVFCVLLFQIKCETNTFTDGKTLYTSMCANCHMDNGEGLGALIPPLAKADYLILNRDKIPCIVHYGIKDSIVVNGKVYKEEMINYKTLNLADLTNILNYVNNSWGNQNGVYRLDEVQKMIKDCE
jgi:mono/diheme cytochrome c family protein